MGNKKIPTLTLSFLLMAALCLDAFIRERIVYYSYEKMTWTEARKFCQKAHIDLVTLNTLNTSWLSNWLVKIDVTQVWIGLVRDPENDSVWKWINLKTGEGISGDDVSQSIKWASESPTDCALVSEKDLTWSSEDCSSEYEFYCSAGNSFQHHNITLNWYKASQYCRDNSSDLATITQTNTKSLDKQGWIGLHRKNGGTWRWIGDLSSDYRNWAEEEPLNADCASYGSTNNKCHSHHCSRKLQALCYDDNLVVVNENKTWEEALEHCWDMGCADSKRLCMYRYSLLSLDYLSDYNYVRDRIYRATTDEIWTALRFLGGKWWWVTGQKLKDHGMLPSCPSQRKHCGTLSKYDTNNWIIRDCSERRNFICYRTKEEIVYTKTEKQTPQNKGQA